MTGPIQRKDSAGPPARPRPRRWLIVRGSCVLVSLFWIGTLLSASAVVGGLPAWLATWLARLGDMLCWPLPLGVTAFTVWALARFDRIAGGSER
jgi:hypothetical protein